jgi:hypothetical protein
MATSPATAPDNAIETEVASMAFFFHDPVRYISAKLVPQLLSSYKKAYGSPSNELAGLWAASVDKILEVLSAEPGESGTLIEARVREDQVPWVQPFLVRPLTRRVGAVDETTLRQVCAAVGYALGC